MSADPNGAILPNTAKPEPEPPPPETINDPTLFCGFDLFYSDGTPFYRVACGFPCCINPPSAGSDESEKWLRTLAAREEAHPNGTPTPSEQSAMSPTPPRGSSRSYELGLETPPGGWDNLKLGRKQDKLLQSNEPGEPGNVIDLRSPPIGKGKGKRPCSPQQKPDFGDDSD
jgi:hypothetical protein